MASKITKHESDVIKIYKLNKGTKQFSEHIYVHSTNNRTREEEHEMTSP